MRDTNPFHRALLSLADRRGAIEVAEEFPKSAANRSFHGRPPEWHSVLRGINLLARVSLLLPLVGEGASLPGFSDYVAEIPEACPIFPRSFQRLPFEDAPFIAGIVQGGKLSYSEFDRRWCQVRRGGKFTLLSSFEAKAEAVSDSFARGFGSAPSLVAAPPGTRAAGLPTKIDLSGVAYAPELLEDVLACAGVVLARREAKKAARKKPSRGAK